MSSAISFIFLRCFSL